MEGDATKKSASGNRKRKERAGSSSSTLDGSDLKAPGQEQSVKTLLSLHQYVSDPANDFIDFLDGGGLKFSGREGVDQFILSLGEKGEGGEIIGRSAPACVGTTYSAFKQMMLSYKFEFNKGDKFPLVFTNPWFTREQPNISENVIKKNKNYKRLT